MKTGLGIFLLVTVALAPSARATDSIGLKNFREIYESLAMASGVTPDATIAAAFLTLREVLPKYGVVEEYNAPMAMAVTKLSGYFCKAFVDSDALKKDPKLRRSHKKVDFKKRPADVTEEVRREVLTDYAAFYWQRVPTETELTSLLQLMDKVNTGTSQLENTAATKLFFQLPCMAVASSLDFLTI